MGTFYTYDEAGNHAARIAENPPFPGTQDTAVLAPQPGWAGFERLLVFDSAYDGRHEPENYGVHCCDMMLVLVGRKGAISLRIFTGWHLPHVARSTVAHAGGDNLVLSLLQPTGADISYHSPTRPRWAEAGEDDWMRREDCGYTPNGICWCDGSSLRAEDFMLTLIAEGWDAVWQRLKREYRATFLTPEGTCYDGPPAPVPLLSRYCAGVRALEREGRLRARERRAA